MFDKRITLGNVLTLVAMLVAGLGAFYTQNSRIEQLGARLDVQDARISFIDNDTQRRLGRIENKLDQLLSER
ncbi:hypothetical protein [Thalassobius sp. I31.1]|uniref:hypothetical protein n=1 Tax=Thalassobius sp. I31.1 TaxID=2109912 RepID=UPI000D19A0F2|nr:hypothetical protein [Thalassobius sp. I31.1]